MPAVTGVLATQVFGSLLKILPLEEGIPDPVGMSRDLLVTKQNERVFLEQLLDTSKVQEYVIPVPLRAELRKYQREGISWFGFLFKYRCASLVL